MRLRSALVPALVLAVACGGAALEVPSVQDAGADAPNDVNVAISDAAATGSDAAAPVDAADAAKVDAAEAGAPADDHEILYISNVDNHVWKVRPDGTDPVDLQGVPAGAVGNTVGWAVGRTKVLFDYLQDPDRKIAMMNSDGTGLAVLPVVGAQPVMSNGRIFFLKEQFAPKHIYSIDPSGLNEVPLTLTMAGTQTNPCVSSDGKRLAFDSSASIYVMPSDGSTPPVAVVAPTSFMPVWSPDGKRLAFVRASGADGDVVVADADGSNELAVTTGANPDFQPSWSGDGARLVFSRRRPVAGGSTFDLYTVKTDGTRAAKIVTDGRSPSWY